MNLRNPEATLISVPVTQHISPGYTDPGTGSGAVFHVLLFGFPAEQGTPGCPQSQLRADARSTLGRSQCRTHSALPSPGQQPGTMIAVFTDKCQPVLFSKSLTQSVAPTAAAPATERWPHGLLNLVTAAPALFWHLSAPTATWTKPFTNLFFILEKCLSDTSSSRASSQFAGLRFQEGFALCSESPWAVSAHTRALPSPRPTRATAFLSAPLLPECGLCVLQKCDFGRTAVSKVVQCKPWQQHLLALIPSIPP